MIVDLPNTTTPQVEKRLQELRDSGGVVALGRVLTLIIETSETDLEAAVAAANSASRMHPSRIIVVSADSASESDNPRLDAQIRVGGDAGASEVVVLRAFGAAATNQESLVTGLLLPDAPVVLWWPEGGPEAPISSPLGKIASRRITDSAAHPDSEQYLARLASNYEPGDGDMAWTRITLWRSQIAALLDQYQGQEVEQVTVIGSNESPSALLLASWLHKALSVPVTRESEVAAKAVSGIYGVVMSIAGKTVSMTRESTIADIRQTGRPDGSVLLPPRGLQDCLVEDLRFLGEDITYATVLKSLIK
jgi:glucose-6-phosphate dehydrogenase assembly protein OpcA